MIQILIGGIIATVGAALCVAGIMYVMQSPKRAANEFILRVLFEAITDQFPLLLFPILLIVGGVYLIGRGLGWL